jgi:hypothetical protein
MTARATADHLLAVSPYATIMGLAGLTAVALMSFEEPPWRAFLLFGAMSNAAPIALALHLHNTTELTNDEKRLWVRGLTTWKVMTLFPAYFSAAERAKTTRTLRETSKPTGPADTGGSGACG